MRENLKVQSEDMIRGLNANRPWRTGFDISLCYKVDGLIFAGPIMLKSSMEIDTTIDGKHTTS